MGLRLLASGALRSSSSRVLSTNARYILIRTICSTPELRKPIEAAAEPDNGQLAGARVHFPNPDPKGMTALQACSVAGFYIARFGYRDSLTISGNCCMRLVEVEKSSTPVASSLMAALPGKEKTSRCQNGSGDHTWDRPHGDVFEWIFLSGLAALFLGLSSTPVLAEDASTELTESDSSGSDFTGLRKIDDGSVVSNLHTSKWRVFTDNGRDLFLQGKLEDAERLFVGALQEAKEGFGERDPHVASACNNLAELYRVKKSFDKAEPLYLEAINILEESYGHEDIRVGAALHNLGQFYLIQRKLDGARACYERALKIKRRVLGEGHADYAETMYHLGKVLHLQGNGKDAEALIQDSIRILEEGGQGESFLCMRRLRYLIQIYINSNKLTDAMSMQRKILHTMEVSKGWDSLETVIAAESLALTLQSVGSLMEAKELLQRCLDSRKRLLSEDDIQIAANMLHMARVELLQYKQTSGDISKAIAIIDEAKDLLGNAIRVARQALDKLIKQGANCKSYDVSRTNTYAERTTLLILLQALNALSQMEVTKAELQESMEKSMLHSKAEKALLDCISVYKEFGTRMLLSNSADIKGEYLSCLKHLSALLSNSRSDGLKQSRRPSLQEVENEIKRVEAGLSMPNRKP